MPLPLGILSMAGAALIAGGGAPDRVVERPEPAPNPAPRLIFWVGCEQDVVKLTNKELVEWKANGVDGFVCMVGHLRDLGGDQDFTGNAKADLSGPNYSLQRALSNSDIARRASARGLKMYLGVYFANYFNTATPLVNWFKPWSANVLPKLTDLAGAAKLLGFAGIAFDQELYQQQGGAATAIWGWDYPGNNHPEAEVRAQARKRGATVMDAILSAFPKAEFAVYGAVFPGDWTELVQETVHSNPHSSTDRVDVDFWDGMTSVEGYKAIRFYDSIVYKSPHLGNWENALTYLQNSTYATFSQRFSNWRHAWSRVHVAPFAWIDEGPDTSPFDDARPVAEVAEQLLEFRKWSAGGEFANFAYDALKGFDYSDYAGAMREASTADRRRSQRPTLKVTAVSKAGGRMTIEGTAHDNLAIRAVRWRDGQGHKGVAVAEWEVLSGDYRSAYRWQTRWSIATRVRNHPTEITITAVDLEGQSSREAVVDRRDLAGSDSA